MVVRKETQQTGVKVNQPAQRNVPHGMRALSAILAMVMTMALMLLYAPTPHAKAEETQETTAIKTEVAKEEIEASESAKEDEDVEETQATEPEVQVQDVTEEAAYIEEPKEEQPVVNTIVMEVIDRINSERVAAGAAPVVYDAVLNTMAQVRASENADNDYFVIENGKHKRPDGSNASSICSDYGQAGYFGEVMGRYQTSPAEIVDGWHNSATHYACMTSTKYNRVGVGIAADSEGYLYWVAIFMD